jgi:putative copper export protein
MMAGIGLLFFGSAAGSRRNLNPNLFVARFMGVGALLLAGHMAAWLYHISPGTGLSRVFSASAVMTTVGLIESARVLLAVLSFWAIAAGRRGLALLLGVTCLGVSGAVGHSAAIDPTWAIPAKIVHLIAVAVWLGGLLWLGWTFRRDTTAFRIEARRVSSAALIAMLAVAGSGVVQALLFLDWPRDLLYSDYGRLVLAKISGLLILILLGAYNRLGLLPHLDDSRKGRKLSRSVSQEVVIMLAILIISGFLANTPPPLPAADRVTPVGTLP